jgi:ATP-dependent DNA helicase DinG
LPAKIPLTLKNPVVLEVQVHQHLLRLQRELNSSDSSDSWPHQFAMGRLVAQALRRQESVVIQTGIAALGASSAPLGRVLPDRSLYQLSYLAPALLYPGPIAIVLPDRLHTQVFSALPLIQQALGTNKLVYGDRLNPDLRNGLHLLTPAAWLERRSSLQMPVLIDGADRLSEWLQDYLQMRLMPEDWQSLLEALPGVQREIEGCMKQLQQSLWQRTPNPYNCYLLATAEIDLLCQLSTFPALPAPWPQFLAQLLDPQSMCWGEINRQRGVFTLCTQPKDYSKLYPELWTAHSQILIGNVLDVDRSASGFRQAMGLGDIPSVKFAVSARPLRLYTPNWMPMPNSRNFQELFIRETINVLRRRSGRGLAVVIVGDTPLKAQTAARLAAEYGSLVRMEEMGLEQGQILVMGWEFWNNYQDGLPATEVIIVATLPIPSLEDPLIAAQVEIYKQQRRDWFRSFLLPIGLRILLRSISVLRRSQGLLVILDNRLNHRSYGQQILAALQPCVKLARLEFPHPPSTSLCKKNP